jgi:dolichyl-diphosphooligosaccharide--protein glycosyltransferase
MFKSVLFLFSCSLFLQVYQSKYGKVRIYKVMGVSQESKAWAADPANRICDGDAIRISSCTHAHTLTLTLTHTAPGSWYCVGQYPPAIDKIFEKKGVVKRDFAQLEDFNTKKDERSRRYQEEYHAAMEGKPLPKKEKKSKKKKQKKLEL